MPHSRVSLFYRGLTHPQPLRGGEYYRKSVEALAFVVMTHLPESGH